MVTGTGESEGVIILRTGSRQIDSLWIGSRQFSNSRSEALVPVFYCALVT